ncbi:MAG: plastocyanin/azurin family copper-binding protein [Armatimonadota bacterium]|nr:plastocyanin/azurin family copper-binding protein [Armatimonadota bacterium]MDR7534019.1 plastocyanin/azurin family copper-binding protein [Armatimonadota bacterium]MDR7534986.1 plastocyanin/azurin family copper-binding protein [Armatimonadota bacterium]
MLRARARWRALRVGLATAGVGLWLAAGPPGAAAPAPRPVEIKAREFAFDPREVTVRAGEVTFAVKNEGSIEHNFVLQDGTRRTVAEIAVIPAGAIEDVKVTLRAGTYAMLCTLPGHRDAGMHGTVRAQP